MTEEVAPPERIKLAKGKKWPIDASGRELEVGDFVVFVRFGMGNSGALPMFGHVTKITAHAKVWVKNIKLWDNSKNTNSTLRIRHRSPDIEEKEVKDVSGCIILGKQIEGAFVLGKLADDFQASAS